jgi:hypothetical protein
MAVDTLPLLAKLQPVSLVGLVLLSGLFFLLTSARKSDLPLVNGKRPFEFGIAKARQRYLKNAHDLITSGLAKVLNRGRNTYIHTYLPSQLGWSLPNRHRKWHTNYFVAELC